MNASPRWSWSGLFFGTGFLALTSQVYLLRDLLVTLQGDELVIGLGLAAWLGGITCGALAGRFWSARNPCLWGAWLVGGLPWVSLAGIQAARWGRGWIGLPAGEFAGPGATLVLAAATLMPTGFLVGAVFPVLAAAMSREGHPPSPSIARGFVFESLGTFCGGAATTLFLIPFLTPVRALAAAGCLGMVLAWPAARKGGIRGRAGLAVAGLVLFAGAVSPLAGWVEEAGQRARFAGLAPGIPLRAWKDTPFQHLALGGTDTLSLFSGGQYAFGFPDPSEHESLAHQLACLSATPRRILGGPALASGPLRFLLLHPVERVDLVVPDRGLWDFLRPRLPDPDRRALEDPRVRVIHEDLRRFLAGGGPAYDLMLFLDPVPVTLFQARLSTGEFFAQAASRLSAEGALVLGFSAGPNLLTGESAALAGSLRLSLGAAFPVVRASPGPPPLLLAGRDPGAVTFAPETLGRRWASRGLTSSVFVPELIPLLFPPERIAALQEQLAAAAEQSRLSSDDHPVSLLYGLALRGQLARNPMARALLVAAGRPGWTAGAVALLMALGFLALAFRRRAGLAVGGLLAMAGAAGMTWSLLILFSFQTAFGALYGQLGLLTALFMLGLAGGGFLGGRGLPATSGRARRRLLWASSPGLILSGAISLGLAQRPASGGAWAGLLVHGLFLAGAGVVTGLFFPAAAAWWVSSGGKTGQAAGWAQAADHLGAALAAGVVSGLLVPALGLTLTAWMVGAGLLLGSLGVLTARAVPPTD